jgi:hypothetical protein
LLVDHHPSTGAADKKAKAELIREFLHSSSWTEISELMPLDDLRAGYDAMHRKLEGEPSRYAKMLPQEIDDEIPTFEAPEKETVLVKADSAPVVEAAE